MTIEDIKKEMRKNSSQFKENKSIYFRSNKTNKVYSGFHIGPDKRFEGVGSDIYHLCNHSTNNLNCSVEIENLKDDKFKIVKRVVGDIGFYYE